MDNFSFDPITGLLDVGEYPAVPASETDARGQFQGLLDQIRAYINDTLKSGLESALNPSGAEQIGSRDIEDVDGNTVYEQLANLKDQIDGTVMGQIPDGSLTTDKLGFGIVQGGGAIINGNFDIWQRALSQTSGGYGSDDRWININEGSTKIHTRHAFTTGQSEVPDNPLYCSRTAVTTVAGVSNRVSKSQTIEDVRTLSGETATLSFWAKADAPKNMSIEFVQTFGSGGSPAVTRIGLQKVALTTSWQKFEVTAGMPGVSGKTIGIDSYLQLTFWFDAGSDFDYRTGFLGQQSGVFDIAQVKLEKGSVAIPYVPKSMGEELALCQRYYWQGSATNSGGKLYAANAETNMIVGSTAFPSTMRITPTMSVITAPTYFGCANLSVTNDIDGFSLRVDTSDVGYYRAYSGVYSADAEI